jgi:hypothetical protein
MEDMHSRAYGLAHSAIIIELLKNLLAQGHIIPADAKSILTKAGQSLISKGTDVSAVASEHVKLEQIRIEITHSLRV